MMIAVSMHIVSIVPDCIFQEKHSLAHETIGIGFLSEKKIG